MNVNAGMRDIPSQSGNSADRSKETWSSYFRATRPPKLQAMVGALCVTLCEPSTARPRQGDDCYALAKQLDCTHPGPNFQSLVFVSGPPARIVLVLLQPWGRRPGLPDRGLALVRDAGAVRGEPKREYQNTRRPRVRFYTAG